MKRGLRFPGWVLGVVVLFALPCSAQQASRNIQVHAACRNSFLIFDFDGKENDSIRVYVNGKENDNVFKLPNPPCCKNMYEVSIPDSTAKEPSIIIKINGFDAYTGKVSFNAIDTPCVWPRPCITTITPSRILEGGKLVITGTGFGSRNTDLTLLLRNNTPIVSQWVSSPGDDKLQTAHFLVPTREMKTNLWDGKKMWTPGAPVTVIATIDGKRSLESNWGTVTLVRSDAKWWVFVGCVILAAGIFVIVFMLVRSCHDAKVSLRETCLDFFYDKRTNTYSLSKFQALGWTVVITWSYLYLALGRIILTGDVLISDLNPSVLGLLGISYSGLLAARGVGNAFPKNDIVATKPKLSDFISENNEISLPRLQLFAFSWIGFAIYIAATCNPEYFASGLPTVPDTLNGLYLVSQGGYIGGKLTGASAVNHILPRRITAPFSSTITLYGKGFSDKTSLLVQGLQESFMTTFMSQNELRFSLKDKQLDPGLKQLIIIPPTGSSYVIDNAIEVIRLAIHRKTTVDSCGAPAMEVDFKDIVLGGEPLSAYMGDTPVSITHLAGNRYKVSRPGGMVTGDTIRIAAQDGSFAFETTVNGTATEGYEPVTLL